MSLTEDLQSARTSAREAADELVTRAASEERDMSAEELSQYQDHLGEEREAAERLESLRDDEVRELRASVARATSHEERAGLGELLLRTITGASGAGSAFTPSEFASSFWDKLSAQSVALQIPGVRVIETNRDSLVIPRWKSDTTAAWVSENGQIGGTDADADVVTAVPRKLAGLQYASNESLADSNPSLYDAIAAGLTRAIALKFDLGFFEGSGTPPEVRGLKNVVGIQTANAGAPDLDDIMLGIELLMDVDATPTAVIMHPRALTDYWRIKESTTNNNKPVLLDSAGSAAQGFVPQIFGLPVLSSSQLDPNDVYMVDGSQLAVVRRSDVTVETDTSIKFDYDVTAIRAITRVDVVAPNPLAIVHMFGVS